MPLALPGLQLADASVRNASPYANANPLSQVLGTVFQSFWGQPLTGSFINAQGFYVEQWVYVGAIAVALTVMAVVVRWRRPEVVALAVATLVAVAASILQPVDDLLNQLPLIGHSWWSRALIPLAFCLAMLGALGLDAVLHPSERRRAARWALGAFGTMALVLGLIWLFGRGHLLPYEMRVREPKLRMAGRVNCRRCCGVRPTGSDRTTNQGQGFELERIEVADVRDRRVATHLSDSVPDR